MQVNTKQLNLTKGALFSEIFEYKEDNKRVYTDYTGFEFKMQFRAAKSATSTLLATAVPVATGLGQIKAELAELKTAVFSAGTAYYDILAKAPAGQPFKLYEGSVAVDVPTSVTQWESTAPVTTASVIAGIYNVDKTVSLSANEAGAVIYYSIDGSIPSLIYTVPLVISASTTLKFFAVDTAGNNEVVNSIVYTIDKVAPVTTCSVAADSSILTTDEITLTANETATIYYTTNGSTPTTLSSTYTAPFTLPVGNQTVKFFAVDAAGNIEVVKTVANITVA